MGFFSRFGKKDSTEKSPSATVQRVQAPAASDIVSALSLHLQGELDEAWDAYQGLAADAPGAALARFFAAAITAGRGKVPQAVETLRALSRESAEKGESVSRALVTELVPLASESVVVKFAAVAAVAASFGDLLKEGGFLREGAVCYEVAAGLAPDNAHFLHKLGDTLHDLGVYDYAETVLTEAIKLAPNHWGALYSYAVLLQDAGREEEAIAQYEKAVSLIPNHAKCRNNLGAALFRSGRLEEALEHCKAAEALDPALPLAKINLGYIHLVRQDYQAARASFSEAVALNDKLFPALFGLASVEEALQGEPKRIQDLYLQAIELHPTSGEVHHALAKHLAAQGDQQSLLHFSTAAVLNEELKDLHKDYGLASLRFGKREQALEQFRIALRQNPGDAEVQELIATTEGDGR